MPTQPKLDPQNTGLTERRESSGKINTNARFWNWIAERYAAKPVANEDVYTRKLAITRNYLHADSEVLELGCGTGSTALVHAPYVRHIRATDFSSKMIEIANNKALAAGVDNVDFACRAADNAGAPDVQYDAILALSLLHLLVDWSSTIRTAHRMLKSGGVLITSTVCMNDGFAFMRLIAPLGRRVGLLPQLSFFTRFDLECAMSEAGFVIENAWQPAPKTGLFLVARKPSSIARDCSRLSAVCMTPCST